MGVAALLDVWGKKLGGGLRSCACSRTGWGRHHHHHKVDSSFISGCSPRFSFYFSANIKMAFIHIVYSVFLAKQDLLIVGNGFHLNAF